MLFSAADVPLRKIERHSAILVTWKKLPPSSVDVRREGYCTCFSLGDLVTFPILKLDAPVRFLQSPSPRE